MTGQKPAESEPNAADTESSREKKGEQRDWADEAAEARTADDPRAVAPHDRTGIPSTGDTR